MPPTTRQSDANTLPDPELNPLLNPLLAAHLGRWAEVYFTTPPEKRQQAVSELLRELRSGAPSELASVQVIAPVIPDEKSANQADPEEAPDWSAPGEDSLHICGVCAHQNSAVQRFCGMCGAPLQISPEAHVPQAAAIASISAERGRQPEPSREFSPTSASHDHNPLNSPWTPLERSLPHFDVEPESAPNRYRVYAGVLLAILLALLFYMAWRGAKAISGTTGTQSAAAQAIPSSPPAAPAPAVSEQPATTRSASSEGNLDPSAVQTENPPAATPQKNQPARQRPASPVISTAEKSSVVAAEQNGTEELATAEKYLNGAQGMSRDRREAAQWLWKAVGKGNLAATMALSDLYLHGDGVPKSCDQARLLLDAAARKGRSAAADRLRNLPAFGCD